MSARAKARKRALDVLFEADQRRANLSQTLDERLVDSGRQVPLPEYTVEIVRGVVDHWTSINATLESHAKEWTLARMPAVDRAILRIAVWELLYSGSIPASVAIDQAVELATDLSTDDSPRFINGVLGAIASHAATVDPSAQTDEVE